MIQIFKGEKIDMKNKVVSYLSYGSLIIGVLIGTYAFIEIYLMKSKLPSDVCPVTSNRPLIYVAIAFCFLSFLLSFFETKDGEKQDINKNL